MCVILMQFGTSIIHVYVTKLFSLLLVKKNPVMSTLKCLYSTGKSVNVVNYRNGPWSSFEHMRLDKVVPQVVLCSLQNNSLIGDYETAPTGAVIMTEPDVSPHRYVTDDKR
jgi:hypothetical protein